MAGGRDSTERFGDRAIDYASFRPGYPDRAIDELLAGLGSPAALAVADVGAGTGISARAIAERGARVIAIEPNAAMREAAHPHARVSWQDGTGEVTHLEDASVDVVCACQAFHWFATAKAIEEFRRISRRRAALLQNERDERDPFTRAFGDVVRAYATDDTEALRMAALETFSAFPNAGVIAVVVRPFAAFRSRGADRPRGVGLVPPQDRPGGGVLACRARRRFSRVLPAERPRSTWRWSRI